MIHFSKNILKSAISRFKMKLKCVRLKPTNAIKPHTFRINTGILFIWFHFHTFFCKFQVSSCNMTILVQFCFSVNLSSASKWRSRFIAYNTFITNNVYMLLLYYFVLEGYFKSCEIVHSFILIEFDKFYFQNNCYV